MKEVLLVGSKLDLLRQNRLRFLADQFQTESISLHFCLLGNPQLRQTEQKSSKALREQGIPTTIFWGNQTALLGTCLELFWWLKKKKNRLIHSLDSKSHQLLALLSYLPVGQFLKEKNWVLSLQNDPKNKSYLQSFLNKRAKSVANHLWIDPFYYPDSTTSQPFAAKSTYFAEPPIGFISPPICKDALLNKLNIPNSPSKKPVKLIGLFTELEHSSRIKDAIWAESLLDVVSEDHYLLIIGSGTQKKRLYKFFRQTEVRDSIRIIDDKIQIDQIFPHLDFLWEVGSLERSSSAISTAMELKIPIIASRTATHEALFKNDPHKYLFAIGDRAGLARHTYALLRNESPHILNTQTSSSLQLPQSSVPPTIKQYGEALLKLYQQFL